MHHHVEFAQELDGVQIFATTILVGDPFAGLARVIQIEHRGDRIDTQPVDVALRQPVVRAGQQEAFHLLAAVVENIRAPILVETRARIFVFVKRGAVEARQ